jgi:dTDP-4-dehydrorhamnose 3,5-epimerase
MNSVEQSIEGLRLFVPDVFGDLRGTFRRNYCKKTLLEIGINFECVQGNISYNKKKYTMRGFHYQKLPSKESKILTPITGCIFNVVIDLRKNSNTYLKYCPVVVDSNRFESLLVPAGCANAFLTLEANTFIQYYMGDIFRENSYSGFRYDDPFFSIEWPQNPVVISDKDKSFKNFSVENI